MSKYRVHFTVHQDVMFTMEVEAENEENAKNIIKNANDMELIKTADIVDGTSDFIVGDVELVEENEKDQKQS